MRDESNELIDLMKAHMKQTVDYMNDGDLDVYFQVFTSQYNVLKQLFEIERLKEDVGVTDKPTVKPNLLAVVDTIATEPVRGDVAPIVEGEPTVDEDLPVKDIERQMYRVERKLRGGYIDEISGFIPETILRMHDIEHGDYVYAEPIESQAFGQKRYDYTLAKKAVEEIEPTGRVEYLYCPVEKDGHLLVVRRSSSTGERIRLDDAPYSVLLTDGDIERFDISEGDIVDIAFYNSKPDTARVFWKHDVEEMEHEETLERKRLDSTKGKSSNSNKKTDVEQDFIGKTICIIGDKPNEAAYKALVEERGGEHLQIEPSWNISRIETFVRKSDVVVGLYDWSEHTGLIKAKEYCKQYGIPYDMISGRGKTKAIQTAIELLKAIEPTEVTV